MPDFGSLPPEGSTSTGEPQAAEDLIWCHVRGKNVPVSTCHDNCAAPWERPICWLGKTAREPGNEFIGEER